MYMRKERCSLALSSLARLCHWRISLRTVKWFFLNRYVFLIVVALGVGRASLWRTALRRLLVPDPWFSKSRDLSRHMVLALVPQSDGRAKRHTTRSQSERLPQLAQCSSSLQPPVMSMEQRFMKASSHLLVTSPPQMMQQYSHDHHSFFTCAKTKITDENLSLHRCTSS